MSAISQEGEPSTGPNERPRRRPQAKKAGEMKPPQSTKGKTPTKPPASPPGSSPSSEQSGPASREHPATPQTRPTVSTGSPQPVPGIQSQPRETGGGPREKGAESSGTSSGEQPRDGKQSTLQEQEPSGEELRLRIEQRAYALYVARGYQHGHAEEDWLEAERQIMNEQRNRHR